MSFLGLVPQTTVASIEPRSIDEPVSAEQFVEHLYVRLQDMERTLAEDEQLEVVAFLPSGKAISVDTMGYENPALVILNGQEQDTGKACTLLAHQSSVQVLVSVEPIQSGKSRKVLRFTHEK
jgi:hypothetical protein